MFRSSPPLFDRANVAIVAAVMDAIDKQIDVVEKAEKEPYKGWGGPGRTRGPEREEI